MQAEAFSEALRAITRRRPFKPFVVQLVSGDRIDVEHPEALVFRGSIAVYFSPKGELAIFDNEGVAQLTDMANHSAPA